MDTAWLLMAFTGVAILAFVFGSALDAIMRDDGFGPMGNMVIFTGGFFLAIYLLNLYGVRLHDLTMAGMAGLGGAFVSITLLALGKAALARI